MAGAVDRYRDLVGEKFGTSDSFTASDVADEAMERYQERYLESPAEYEQRVLARRIAALPEDDPRRLALTSGTTAGLSPDATFAALYGGLQGNSELVQQLMQYDSDVAAAAAEAQQNANVAEFQQQQDERDLQATEDWSDWGPINFLKSQVRNAFITASAPIEIVSNIYRWYGGEVTGGNETRGGLDGLYDVFAGTQLGAISTEIARGNLLNLETGDGWFGVDPESAVGRKLEKSQADLWTLSNGDIATFGRSMALAFGADKGTTAYDLLSGVADAAFYVFDPVMYIPGGQAKTAALAARAYLKGGSEASAAVRAVRSGEAVGPGVSSAREVTADVEELAGEVERFARLRDEQIGIAKASEADAARARERFADSDVALLDAESARVTAQQQAVAARQEYEELRLLARDEFDAEVRPLDEQQAKLDNEFAPRVEAEEQQFAADVEEARRLLDEVETLEPRVKEADREIRFAESGLTESARKRAEQAGQDQWLDTTIQQFNGATTNREALNGLASQVPGSFDRLDQSMLLRGYLPKRWADKMQKEGADGGARSEDVWAAFNAADGVLPDNMSINPDWTAVVETAEKVSGRYYVPIPWARDRVVKAMDEGIDAATPTGEYLDDLARQFVDDEGRLALAKEWLSANPRAVNVARRARKAEQAGEEFVLPPSQSRKALERERAKVAKARKAAEDRLAYRLSSDRRDVKRIDGAVAAADDAVAAADARVVSREGQRDLLAERLRAAEEAEAAAAAARDEAAAKVDEFVARVVAERNIPDVNTAEGLLEFLRSEMGLTTLMDGSQTGRVDLALQSVFGGKLDPVMAAFARIDDPAELFALTRGKIASPSLLNALARADTPERVKSVLVNALARGELTPEVGRLRVLRSFSRMTAGRSTAEQLSNADRAFGMGASALRWSMNATQRRTPWSYDVHIEDADQFLRATSDYIAYSMSKAPRAEREAMDRKWVRRMMDAADGVERKEIAFAVQDDIAEYALRQGGVDPESAVGQAVLAAVKSTRAAQNGAFSYNLDEIAKAERLAKEQGLDVATLRIGDEDVAIPTTRLPLLASALNDRFHFADPKKMRRLVKSAKSLEKRRGLKDPNAIQNMYNTLFDDYWRTLVLLRVSYVVRNTMEEQARMALSRQPNLFTSPLTALGVISQGRRWEKLFKGFRVADVDVTGKNMRLMPDADAAASDAMGEFQRDIIDNGGALLDIGSPEFVNRQARAGFAVARKGDSSFWSGAANDVLMLNQDELARTVRQVMRGNVPDEVRAYAQRNGITAKQAVARMALEGKFGGALGKVTSVASRRDPSLAAALRSEDGALDFLFNAENPFSYASRWNKYTNGLDPDFVALLDQTEYMVPPRYLDGPDAARSMVTKLSREMKSRFGGKDVIDGYQVEMTGVPIYVDAAEPKAGWWRTNTGRFFSSTGNFMRATGVAPELQYAYWESASRYIAGMSPEAARDVVQVAEETLGKITSAWAARQLSKVRSAAAKADGGLTADDVHRLAEADAWRRAEDLFYVAKKRNMLSHQLRFIFPFAQAWGNSLKVYGSLMARNPEVGYRAGIIVEALKGEGSNSIYEVMSSVPLFGDALGVSEYDDTQGFLYNDQYGRLSLQLPFASTAVWGLSNLFSAVRGGPSVPRGRVDTNLQSMNMVFQGGVGPGFSPPAQSVMSTIRNTSQYNSLPDGLRLFDNPLIKDQVALYNDPSNPYSSSVQDFAMSLLPGPVGGFTELVNLDVTVRHKKYVQPMMAALYAENPERYSDVDASAANGSPVLTDEGQRRLRADAEQAARGFAFAHSIVRFASPGTLKTEQFVKAQDGRLVMLTAIGAEYQEALARHDYDSGLALQDITDRYGVNIFPSLVGPRESLGFFPSDVAYQWYMSNPDANIDPATADMFFPDGRYSREMAALATAEGGRQKSAADLAEDAARLMYSAEMDKLTRDRQSGAVTEEQYAAAANDLKRRWATAFPDGFESDLGQRIARLGAALNEPGIEQAPAYESVRRYWGLREYALDVAKARGSASLGLGNKANADLAAWLLAEADVLLARDPSFKDAYDLVKREIEEDN